MTTKSTQRKAAGGTTQSIPSSITSALEGVGTTPTEFFGALSAGGRAYAGAVNDLGKALFGFGKDVVDEGVNHAKATMQAKSLRDLAELQAAYAQNRVENTAAHAQEFVELARVKTEEVIAPFAGLIKPGKAA